MKALALVPVLLLAAPPQEGQLSFEEAILSVIPDDANAGRFVFSRDGRHVAYRMLKAGTYLVMADKTPGPPYAAIGDEILFNADGKPVYRAKDGAQWVIRNGDQTTPPIAIIGKPVLGPDGRKLAYECSRGTSGASDATAWCVYVDRSKGADFASCGSPVFSADGSTVAHSVRIGKGGAQNRAFRTTHAVVVGGKAGPESDEVTSPVFGPKGKSIAYKSRDGAAWSMIVDGKAQGSYTELGMPLWSPDGKGLAYKASRGGKWVVVRDGKPGEEVPRIGGEPVWSPDGGSLAFAAFRGEEGFIVVNGKPLETFQLVDQPVFSSDGLRVAYPAKAAGQPKWMIVWGDRKGEPHYDTLETPVWSPDGKHIAYRALWKFKWIVVVDDGKNEMFDAIGPVTWSPDSAKVAYPAQKDGKWHMVVHYRRLEAFDEILTPGHWSADSKKVAFGARKGQHLVWRVVATAE